MDNEATLIVKFVATLIVSVIIIVGAIVGMVEIVNLITVPTVRVGDSFNYVDSNGMTRVCQIADNEVIAIKCLEPAKND